MSAHANGYDFASDSDGWTTHSRSQQVAGYWVEMKHHPELSEYSVYVYGSGVGPASAWRGYAEDVATEDEAVQRMSDIAACIRAGVSPGVLTRTREMVRS